MFFYCIDRQTVITFSQNEFHKIWENTLENFGFYIGGIPLKNNFEEGLSNFEHHIWTGCGSFVYGVPFAVDENGILKQLREVNADYIITIPNYNGYRFSGTIYRAKDLIKVAEFYSDLNFSVEDNDKTFLKRRRLLNKLWNKSKKVEGINLTRDDFISVIFDELIKSSEKIYEDISKFKSDDYLRMPVNEFFNLCDNRAIIIDAINVLVPPVDIDTKTSENNETFDYSRFSYKIEQYDIDGKVIDRLLISLARFAKTMEDGSFYSYNGISSIERDPIFEKN